jgi:heme-degrading monooxygenase HmoA
MHVIVWEFSVPGEHQAAFEQAYGPDGAWAALFQTAPGYLGTELLRDEQMIGRYLTIDRWRTPEDFAAFKSLSGAAYESLDRRFEGLAAREAMVGTFRAAA